MSPPLLVVEVVNPGELQRERDYIAKRFQYHNLDIPEYWIFYPETQSILILELTAQNYRISRLSGNDLVLSPRFRFINLKVLAVFDREN